MIIIYLIIYTQFFKIIEIIGQWTFHIKYFCLIVNLHVNNYEFKVRWFDCKVRLIGILKN